MSAATSASAHAALLSERESVQAYFLTSANAPVNAKAISSKATSEPGNSFDGRRKARGTAGARPALTESRNHGTGGGITGIGIKMPHASVAFTIEWTGGIRIIKATAVAV
jgi:hypothetical protein